MGAILAQPPASLGPRLSSADYQMAALATTSDQDPVVATGISHTPFKQGLVQVKINGQSVKVGNGSKVADCYFSTDGGTNARNLSAIVQGDTCHWMGSHAGYELTTDDRVSFIYSR